MPEKEIFLEKGLEGTIQDQDVSLQVVGEALDQIEVISSWDQAENLAEVVSCLSDLAAKNSEVWKMVLARQGKHQSFHAKQILGLIIQFAKKQNPSLISC